MLSRVGGGVAPGRDPFAAWLFPELVLALAPVSTSNVTVAAGARVLVAKPNPRRIGLVFVTPVTDAGGCFVGPFSDPDIYGFPIPTSERVLAFAVDDLYGMIAGAWYCYHAAGVVLRVSEFVRPA